MIIEMLNKYNFERFQVDYFFFKLALVNNVGKFSHQNISRLIPKIKFKY